VKLPNEAGTGDCKQTYIPVRAFWFSVECRDIGRWRCKSCRHKGQRG